jgi:DNA-directed RNA polymerase specialized sigma24 family protein
MRKSTKSHKRWKVPADKRQFVKKSIKQYGKGEPKFWRRNDWIDYVNTYISYLKHRVSKHTVRFHDWEDITQRALMTVWKGRKSYNSNRPLKPWIKTVVHRVYVQFLQTRVFCNYHTTEQSSEFKRLATHPEPILTRLVESDSAGNEEVQYEPDMPAPHSPESYDEFVGTLSPTEQLWMHLRYEHKKHCVIRKKMKISCRAEIKLTNSVEKKLEKYLT